MVISTAEEALSATIEKHLTNLINQADGNIHEKMSKVLDKVRKSGKYVNATEKRSKSS